MSPSRFSTALDRGLEHLEIALDATARQRLASHFDLLCKWAPKVNLTTVLEPEAAASLHYLDSLAYLKVDSGDDDIIDVGTGAGFPGLVLAAATARLPPAGDPLGRFPTGGLVVSRATFPPEVWLDGGRSVLGPGGRLVLSRGRGGAEIPALEDRAAAGGLVCMARVRLELPGGHHRILDAWRPARL